MPIPEFLAPAWNALHWQVVLLNLSWRFHEQLFLKDKRREFLNEIAGSFFAVVQENFLLEVQLRITRLRDDEISFKQRNLTLRTLRKILHGVHAKPHDDSEKAFFRLYNAQLKEFEDASKPISDRRNKYLAHSDYQYALGLQALPGPTRNEIEVVLAKLSALMNTVATHFGENATAYSAVYTDGSAENVVGMLKAAKRYFQVVDKELDGDVHISKWGDV